MKEERRLHIAAIAAFAVFVVLGLACATKDTSTGTRTQSSSSTSSTVGSPVNVTFRNLTGVKIVGLFVDISADSLMDSNNWLYNDDFIAPGSSYSIRLAPRRYLVLAIGEDATFYSFAFTVSSSGGSWPIERSDKLDL